MVVELYLLNSQKDSELRVGSSKLVMQCLSKHIQVWQFVLSVGMTIHLLFKNKRNSVSQELRHGHGLN